MKRVVQAVLSALLVLLAGRSAATVLVPMDLTQTDHLRAYGLAYWCLVKGWKVEWLLNYRGGSFLITEGRGFVREARIRGVSFTDVDEADMNRIFRSIQEENMESVLLETPPKVAVYTPPNTQPWDDAVTLALTYAEIPFTKVWDREVLSGELGEYDWLHLHHEDFTGQYGKFYSAYHSAEWYRRQKALYEEYAKELGYESVSEEKKAVARKIKQYVARGGFLFAMCSATDTFDIALAAEGMDMVDTPFDGDPPDPDCQSKLNYDRCLAFTGFKIITNPLVYEFSDIDTSDYSKLRGPEADYFTLFEFSAKYDPVPTMLTQCHVSVINGFMGQTTGFKKELIKRGVTILAEVEGAGEVKYLHGNYGRGTFTFYGGHDPEDYQHAVGDPPTDLSLHKNSPGYRLILNNILFPAAKKKERKT